MKYFTRNAILEVAKGEYTRGPRSVLLLRSGVGTGDQESAKGSDSDAVTLGSKVYGNNMFGRRLLYYFLLSGFAVN